MGESPLRFWCGDREPEDDLSSSLFVGILVLVAGDKGVADLRVGPVS